MTAPTLSEQLAQLEQAMRELAPTFDDDRTILEWADTLHALQQQIQDETTPEQATADEPGRLERLGRMAAPASAIGPQTAAGAPLLASDDRSRDGRP